MQLTGSVLIYTNNEYNKEINLYIIKDPFGLNIIIDQVTGENTVHRNSYEIDDSNILNCSNLSASFKAAFVTIVSQKIEAVSAIGIG